MPIKNKDIIKYLKTKLSRLYNMNFNYHVNISTEGKTYEFDLIAQDKDLSSGYKIRLWCEKYSRPRPPLIF